MFRKAGELEEEMKNVTNNLKSLEAAADKVTSSFQPSVMLHNIYHTLGLKRLPRLFAS